MHLGKETLAKFFQTLNPKLQIIKVAFNSQLLKIFIFKSCNIDCIFFILILKALHFIWGAHGLPQFVGVIPGFNFNLRQYRARRVSFLKSIQLLLNSRAV